MYSKCIYTRFELKTSIVCVTPPSHNNAFGRFEVVTRMNESNLNPHFKEAIANGPRGAPSLLLLVTREPRVKNRGAGVLVKRPTLHLIAFTFFFLLSIFFPTSGIG